jgi:hypothetical protein
MHQCLTFLVYSKDYNEFQTQMLKQSQAMMR